MRNEVWAIKNRDGNILVWSIRQSRKSAQEAVADNYLRTWNHLYRQYEMRAVKVTVREEATNGQ